MNKTGSSRTSTNNSIYILHQVITYNPTLATYEKKGRAQRKEGQQTITSEQSKPASSSRGEGGKQYKQYQGRMTRLSHEATKIRYVRTSSVEIVRC